MSACSRVVAVAVSACLACACAQSVGTEGEGDARGEDKAAESLLPPFPEEAVLCRIVFNETTPAVVQAVLGEPTATHDPGGGDEFSGSFFYDYDGGSSLFIGFLHGVFDDAMVDNAPYPSCWRAEETAAVEQLRRIAQSAPPAQ